MLEVLIPILIITILIVLNGIYVAAEFAIIGTPKSTVDAAAAKGDAASRRIAQIKSNTLKQDRYIAASQLGITIASLGLGMYGEHVLAEWISNLISDPASPNWLAAHTVSVVISIGILTYFHVVVGEMIPKTLALKQAHRTAKKVTPVILLTQIVFYPLIGILNFIGDRILRSMGIHRPAVYLSYRTPEELSYIVEESQVGGKLREESASVFRELLEFGDLTAGEVMVPRTLVVGLPRDADDIYFQKTLRERPHSRYPVYVDTLDQIVGIVHVKDLLDCLPNCASKFSEIMRSVPFVPHSADLEHVLKTMTRSHSQMAVVMDEQGGTAGIITIEDLFEEVVGDIRDNAFERPEIYRSPSGDLHVVGTFRIEDLGSELEMELEHEDVDTISGLVLSILGRPALVGDEVEYGGLRFEVTSTKGKGVRECIVRRLEEPELPED